MTNPFQTSHKQRPNVRFLLSLVFTIFSLGVLGIGCKAEKQEVVSAAVKKKVLPVAADVSKTSSVPSVEEKDKTPGDAAGDAQNKEIPSEPEAAPKKMRDPFRAFVSIGRDKDMSRESTARVLTPLQRYSLDQLRVVGVVEGPDLRKALIEDDLGKGYVVGKGDLIGNQGGRIAAIESDRIIIEETVTDLMGVESTRLVTKKLYTPDQQKRR